MLHPVIDFAIRCRFLSSLFLFLSITLTPSLHHIFLLSLTLNCYTELRQELVIVSAFMDKMILANEIKNKEKARAKELIIKAERLSKKKAEQDVKGESIDSPSNVAESKEVEIVSKKRKGGLEAIENVVEDSKLLYLLPFYSRLFSFVMPPKHQNNIIIVNTDLPENSITETVTTDSKRIAVDELSKALFSKFGLNVCLEKLNLGYVAPIEDPEGALKKLKENEKKKTPKPDNRRDKNLERKLKKKGLSNSNDTKPKEGSGNELKFKEFFSLNVLPDGFINFAEVFTEKAFVSSTVNSSEEEIVEAKSDSKLKSVKKNIEGSKKTIETTSPRPLKMEICSGAGEWAVSQVRKYLIPFSLFFFFNFIGCVEKCDMVTFCVNNFK